MIVGHQKQWEILKKSAEAGKLPHAYLFCGDEKLGKKKVAFEFISFLFGENIQKTTHPDFIFIKPIEKEIQISQIRELTLKLSLKNFAAPLKAAILDQAHLMNFEAQSCLLKTLEEPKGETILILLTEHPKVLLPTIISRCQPIKFYPVRESEIESYLISKGISKELAKEISQLSLGRPGLALDFVSDPQKIENYRKAILDLVKIFNSDLFFRFQYAKNISQNSKSLPLARILGVWLCYLRKVLISKINNRLDESEFSFQNLENSEIKNFKNFPLSRIKNFLESLEETIFLLTTKNINQRLALENLMLKL